MVVVTKIAVWEVEGEIFRDSKSAASRARAAIIQELMDQELPTYEEMAIWLASHWDNVESQVERAMAST